MLTIEKYNLKTNSIIKTTPQPIFWTKKIDTEALRRAFKIMKGKRVHRVDNIDSYSLK